MSDGYNRLTGSETTDGGEPQALAPDETSFWKYSSFPGSVSLVYTTGASAQHSLYAFEDADGYLVVNTDSSGDTDHSPVTALQWVSTLSGCRRRSRNDPRTVC